MGIPGDYISIKKEERLSDSYFELNCQINPSLSYLIEKMLPLCDSYIKINNFLNEQTRYEYGKISHALCSCIKTLFKEYLLLITQVYYHYIYSLKNNFVKVH